jgi:rieske iron-sulfur protein
MDDRRKFLQTAALTMLSMPLAQTAFADDENPATEMRPQKGDLFVSEDDEKKIISPSDLQLNQAPLAAFPYDPKGKIVRDGSRLNRVLLVKLDPKTLGETTRQRATPGGIVAYSGICAHQGCPAPRPLAALPVKIAEGKLVAAGTFIGKVGLQQT